MIRKKKVKIKDVKESLDNFLKLSINHVDVIKKLKDHKIANIMIEDFDCLNFEIKNDNEIMSQIKICLDKCFMNFKKHEKMLIKLNIYSSWIIETLKFNIFIYKTTNTFLLTKIDSEKSIKNIAEELINSLGVEIILYKLCSDLEFHLNKKTIKYEHLLQNINELNKIIDIITDNIKTNNNNFNHIHLQIIVDIVSKKFKTINFNAYESGVFNWKTICTKINEYVYNTKPFSLLNIRKTDKPTEIIEEILLALKSDHKTYSNELSKYKSDKIAYFLTEQTIMILDQIKKSKDSLNLLITNPEDEFNILKNLNNYIYETYHKIIDMNNDLNVNNLQNKKTCDDYKKTFLFKSKWFDICENIRKYLYFNNPKKINDNNKYKSIKCQLKSITIDNNIKEKINKIVIEVNDVVIRTYQFIKENVLFKYESKQTLPDVTSFDYISMCVRACCINDAKGNNINGANKVVLVELEDFYEKHCKNIYKEKCNVIGYSNILNFCKGEIVTAFSNNIKMNFLKYIKQYLFSYYSFLNKEEVKNKTDKKNMRNQITLIVDALSKNKLEDMICEEKYEKFFMNVKNKILPGNISEKGIEHDIEENPNKYFIYMIYMNCELENINMKMFNCFPLRTSIVPSSITFDTLSIITLFTKSENGQAISNLLKGDMKVFSNKIWNTILKIKKKQFKWNNNYKFNHTINTDGVNVTILMVDKNLDGVEIRSQKQNDYYEYLDSLGKNEKKWDNKLMKKEIKKLQDKYTFVVNDPGKNPDILHMCNYFNPEDKKEKIKFFKYTTKQRSHELGIYKNRKVLLKFKKANPIISESEKKISEYSSKTCVLEKFKEYVKVKQEMNEKIKPHYNMEFIRKMNLRSYINKLRSESKIVNNIKRIYGEKDKKIMIIYGDWSRTSQMRGVISTPMIGIKRRLGKDFKIMNINEFKTSCLDNISYEKNVEAKVCVKGKLKKLHSVLVSEIQKSEGESFRRYQNRNRNASINMNTIVDHYIKKGYRHPKFSRKSKLVESLNMGDHK